MIEIKSMTLLQSNKEIIKNLSWQVNSGECVVLTGESGSGKTSLINTLNGLIPELYDGKLTGDISVGQTQLPPLDFTEYVKQIGMVFQNPKNQFFTTEVLTELAFSMENYGLSPDLMEQRIKEISQDFDLEGLLGRKMIELSGGQKQRIAFASACMMPHRLFLFDEPSSNLDYESIELLLRQMNKLKKHGHTMVIAEHRLFYLKHLADKFVILKDGEIIEEISGEDFRKMSERTRNTMGLRTLTEPQLSTSLFEAPNIEQEKKIIEIKDLNFSYSSDQSALKVDSLKIDQEQITGIMGENGSGKTTLIKIISGLKSPSSGMIIENDKTLTPKKRLKKSFLVMQDVNLQLFFETVKQELLVKATRAELFDEVVNFLDLKSLINRHPQTLSGGEKQRVAIASAILSGKDWLFLDEPTSGLDYKHMKDVSEMLIWAKRWGIMIVIISHDREFIDLVCDRVFIMENGMVLPR